MSGSNTEDQIDKALEDMKSEHEQLVQTVHKIRDAIAAKDVNTAQQHLMNLQAYQQSHFQHETAFMERHKYPHIEDHKKSHDNLIKVLDSINRLISLENLQRLNGELAVYLEDSLTHIIEADRPLQEFLAATRDARA